MNLLPRSPRQLLPIALIVIGYPSFVLAQGILTPPGAPAPTMKTLDQIEPRIPVNDTTTPGDVNNQHFINQPGSYYLTSNLDVTKFTGISISAEGVTLDLNGFEIRRASGTPGSCIRVAVTAHRCTIKNGSVRGPFVNGVSFSDPDPAIAGSLLDLTATGCTSAAFEVGSGSVIERCRAHDNSGKGISTGDGCTLRHCTVQNAGVGDGIRAGVGCTLSHCNVSGTGTGIGIFANEGSTFAYCVVLGNTSGASASYGIFAQGRCTLIGCTATNNTNSNATPDFDNGIGIRAGDSSTVKDCTAVGNSGDGIHVSVVGTVSGCTANNNGFGGVVVGERSTVTGCTAAGNGGDGVNAGLGSTVTLCTVSKNDGDGLEVGTSATVKDCTALLNQGNGLLVGAACLVSDCVASQSGKNTTPNNTAADGIELTGGRTRVVNCTLFDNTQHGLHSTSTNNRNFIEGCLLHSNDAFGVFLQAGAGDTVIKNQVGGNAGGSINVSGGNVAPIQAASTAVGTIHPLANIQ